MTTTTDRYSNLTLVLMFDSQYERVFTAFERIYIQKERVECIRGEISWKIPVKLNEKVQDILHRIERIGWEHYVYS